MSEMLSGKVLAVAAAVIITVSAGAQSVVVPRALAGMNGIESARSRVFTETSLYGYINGGAELYLEYGFDTLLVTELVIEGSDIKAEVYRMKDHEAAFGIFSVSRFRCNGGARLTEHLCRSAYQLQFCKGPYYVSIINDTGSDDDQKRSADLARLMIENIVEPSFDPRSFYKDVLDDDTMRGAVLVRGPLGVYNGIPGLSEKLGRVSGYSALLIRHGTDTIASMKFDSELAAGQFIREEMNGTGSGKSAGGSDSTILVVSPGHIIITF
ncbi:MAG: hypothetical protein IPI37_02865 [Bacteroidales bacterium]|nr:hypothetical protein [Bacteroidales bacterium]